MIGRKTVLGVSLTPAGAEAALVRGRGARRVPKVLASAVSKTPIADFDPPDSAGMARAFREIAARLPRQARRADVPACVSLPAPLVREDVLRFATFPDSAAEAQDLVRARLMREAGGTVRDPVCSHEIVARADAEVTVRVRSLERALRDAVEAAAGQGGFHVARMEAWPGYASAALGGPPGDGAFLWSDGQSWSLMCWAGAAPEGFAESGWVDGPPAAVAPRLSRLVRSFAMAHELGPLTLVADLPDGLREKLDLGDVGTVQPPPKAFAAQAGPAARVAAWG